MQIEVRDPRPKVEGVQIVGSACTRCGHRWALRWHQCERCLGDSVAARYGPRGEVWASATVHLVVGHRRPPFTLAYVDLEDGPRILARTTSDHELPPGARVRIIGDDEGDIVVTEEPAVDGGSRDHE
jgi:uncharacterized protein